jgi:hypothetical protein
MCSPSSGAARKRGVALTLSANSFDRQREVDQTAIGCPVSPSAPGSFGKSQSGTHFGKMAPRCHRARLAAVSRPTRPSFLGNCLSSGRGRFVEQHFQIIGLKPALGALDEREAPSLSAP